MSTQQPSAEDPWERVLWQTNKPEPEVPLLLTGHQAAAVLGGDGDLALRWETRGAKLEWGGSYAQGVRLTGPWRLSFGPAGATVPPMSATLRSLTARRSDVATSHGGPGWTARHEVVVPRDAPAVGRRLTMTCFAESAVEMMVRATVEPYLLPVLIEGLRPVEYDLRRTPSGVALSAEGFGCELLSSSPPETISIDGILMRGDSAKIPIERIELSWPIRLEPAESSTLAWTIWGGQGRLLREDPNTGDRALQGSFSWKEDRRSALKAWWEERPRFSFPQDPLLEEATLLATGALEALAHSPEKGMVGMVAGYPWYCALWFRDIAWMLPSLLWLGDHEWAASTLETAFGYQSHAHLPVLGAEQGEIPMQVAPGPIFLYGTSDTTLHFPALAHRLLRHVGGERSAFLRPLLPQIRECLLWAERKVDPRSGFFTNGGEIAEMAEVTEGCRVACGIDAHDTTIWDSTDRRDHAVDLQVLYARALQGAAAVSEALEGETASGWAASQRETARLLQERVLRAYDWPQEGYLADTLTKDAGPVLRLRPNALMTVMDDWLPTPRARRLVDRVGREDMTTPWGVRTLSRSDPRFDPEAYHDGQVWTIATDWAAHAAFRAGVPEVGLDYLHTVSGLIRTERGMANECYHGLRAEPFNSCFLLGLSVGPFLTALFEGLWGLSVSSSPTALVVSPNFPPAWEEASLRQLRVGESRLDLRWRKGALTVTQRRGPSVRVSSSTGDSLDLKEGASGTISAPSAS